MPTIFDNLKIGNLTLPNRIIMAPLTRMRSKQPGNIPWELNATYYSQRASAGFIISEATQISQQGQGYPGTPGIHSKEQVQGWKLNHNYFRWVEYSLSSSVMIWLIAQLTGVSDFAALVGIFSVNASMIFFGALQEKYESPGNGQGLPFIFGSMTGIVPWLIIIVYTIQPGGENAAEIPGFVYGIIVALFLFFNTFAFNQAFQYKKIGPWKNYLFGEATYITLSLVAKTILAWQVFSGAIIPAIVG